MNDPGQAFENNKYAKVLVPLEHVKASKWSSAGKKFVKKMSCIIAS
jgi:hypothetical protein